MTTLPQIRRHSPGEPSAHESLRVADRPGRNSPPDRGTYSTAPAVRAKDSQVTDTPKIMYQRAEYVFSQKTPIKRLEVTRQSDKCYWVLPSIWQKKEVRRLKDSNPPLRDTWEEARDDYIKLCTAKLKAKKAAHEEARKDLDYALSLKNPEDQS